MFPAVIARAKWGSRHEGSGIRFMSEAPLLEVSSLVKTYRSRGVGPFARKNARPALAGVSFSMQSGCSFGVVGESGSGKSTLARIALALDRPDSGSVRLQGRSLFDLPRRELRPMRAHMQMIFQDPYGSLDPRQRVEKIVAEPLAAVGGATRAERRARVRASLEAVGLKASDALKHPHEFSGGQRQRIAIARALITRPKLVIADEPVSALDVSVQAQTLNLMSDLERDAGVTFLLISHDLAVVAHICARTAVMFRGRIVEIGSTDALFANPAHPYTRELVDATPRLDRPTRAIVAALAERGGAVSDRAYRPPLHGEPEAAEGCPYAARCAFAGPHCRDEAPVLEAKGDGGRKVACHYPLG
jgi:peptide/nickel transport system ATP-binding protein